MAVVKGDKRARLETYLAGADEDQMHTAGQSWKQKARALNLLAEALDTAAKDAELTIGSETLTGPALRANMTTMATSISTKATKLEAAGDELVEVASRLTTARAKLTGMADLQEQPAAYTPPASTGVPFTDAELAQQAADRQARNTERSDWQSALDDQETVAAAQIVKLDEKFLEAIPPMKAIHGQEDPTEPPPPPPSSPSGPGFPDSTPPTTNTGGGGGGGGGGVTYIGTVHPTHNPETNPPTVITNPPVKPPVMITCIGGFPPEPVVVHPIEPIDIGDPHRPSHPTTTVSGSSQTGIDYQPGTSGPSSPSGSSTSSSGGVGAAGLAAGGGALGAGALGAGGVRGSVSAAGSPTRASGMRASGVKGIGATSRAGASGSISRGAATSATSAGRTSASAGSRGAATGANGRSTGAAGGRGGAGARGGSGTGASQSGRKSDRKGANDRDSLVFDQDWLGDEDVAPGVLD